MGLGNPGERYARTRHNIGWMLADALAGKEAAWKNFHDLGFCLNAGGLILAKPATYMNESGIMVGRLAAFHKIEPGQILVCFDDMDLPLGRLRLRENGSSGGHNGMRSVIDALKTDDVPRLRLGIGPKPEGFEGASFVLSRFSSVERAPVDLMIDAAAQAVALARAQGLSAAMNRFNAKP